MILFYILIISLPLVDHPQFGYAIFGITVEKFLGSRLLLPCVGYLPSRKSFPQYSGYRASADIRRLYGYGGGLLCVNGDAIRLARDGRKHFRGADLFHRSHYFH